MSHISSETHAMFYPLSRACLMDAFINIFLLKYLRKTKNNQKIKPLSYDFSAVTPKNKHCNKFQMMGLCRPEDHTLRTPAGENRIQRDILAHPSP